MERVTTFLKRLGLALLSVALLGLYARFPALAFLPYVALVPWVILYTDDRQPRVFAGYYVFAAWIAWAALYPSTGKYGWFVPFVMGLFMSVPWYPFASVMKRLHARTALPRALTVPLVWIGIEWLRVALTPGDFDLYLLGYSQAPFQFLVQVADVTGVYGVSFLLAAVNGWIADAYFAARDAGSVRAAFSRRNLVSLGSIAGGLAVLVAYSAIRLPSMKEQPGPRIAIVQANTGHKPGAALVDHLEQVMQIEEWVPPGSADLVVLPENAVLDNVRREGLYLDDLAWLASRKQAPILLGAMTWPKDLPGKKRNAAVLVDDRGTIVGEYYKQALFPFTEYVPLDAAFERWAPPVHRMLRRLIRVAWGAVPRAVPGNEVQVFPLRWAGGEARFAVLLCSENTAAPVPAEAARKGADFLVNITSEGDLGGPVQEQLLRICMLRAIENRLAYVRLGNTGISAFIDRGGRIRKILRGPKGGTILEAGTLTERVSISGSGPTAYARSRDAFAKGCMLATLGLFVLPIARRRKGAVAGAVVLALLVTTSCERFPGASSAAEAAASLERGKQAVQRRTPGKALPDLLAACGDLESCRAAMPMLREAFLRSQRLEDAVDFFPVVAARFPDLAPDARAQRAFFLDLLGRPAEAKADYRASLEAQPTAETFGALGAVLLKDDDIEGALVAYGEAVRRASADPELRAQLARALRLSGRTAEAEEILTRVLAERPDAATAWGELGRIRLARGETAGALEAFEQGRRADLSKLDLHFLVGRLALRDGRLDDARQTLAGMKRIHATLRDLRKE